MLSIWQRAWADAQPQLESVTKVLYGRPTSFRPRIQRVGQIDAQSLDEELVTLLKQPLAESFAIFQVNYFERFEPEITLIFKTLLYKLLVWDFGASYGARLQGLRYTRASRGGIASKDVLSHNILASHAVLTVAVPYCHTRLRRHALTKAWPDLPSSDRRRRAWRIITTLESYNTLISALAFLVFLWRGRHLSLADRLVGLRLKAVRPSVARDVSFEFMNRQMVWHGFTEFLLFLLPLIEPRRLSDRLSTAFTTITSFAARNFDAVWANATASPTATRQGKYRDIPEDSCAICRQRHSMTRPLPVLPAGQAEGSSTPGRDIESSSQHVLHLPYATTCGHRYCYACIAEQILQAGELGGPWECLICTSPVTNISRINGEAVRQVGQTVHVAQDGSSDIPTIDGA